MRDEDQIESEIQAKGLTAPPLTPAAIDAVIAAEHYHVFPGSTLTVCALTLRNGFVVTGESAAASAENFDADMGRVLARINAREKIWALEGYLLRQRLSRSGNDARALDVIETVLKKVHANAETQSGYYWTVNVDRRSTKPVLTQWDADMGLWSFMGVSATAGPHELILASGRVDLW